MIRKLLGMFVICLGIIFLLPWSNSSAYTIGQLVGTGLLGIALIVLGIYLWKKSSVPSDEKIVSVERDKDRDKRKDRVEDDVISKEYLKQLKIEKRIFNLRYKGGFPGKKKSKYCRMGLADKGLLFFMSGRYNIDYTIEWSNFVDVLSPDESTSALGQSVMTSVMSKGGALNAGIAAGVASAIETKHPLIINYKINEKDPIVHEAVFDTVENVEIKNEIKFYLSDHFPRSIDRREVAIEEITEDSEKQNISGQIRSLAALKKDRLITEDEYDRKKQDLLDKM